MKKKLFYRVCNVRTYQGLWYSFNGDFTGLIHKKFDFCTNNTLPMPHDPEIIGYLSAMDKLEDIFHWFSREDIIRLQDFGFFLYEYEATDYRQHQNHWIFEKNTARVLNRISYNDVTDLNRGDDPFKKELSLKQHL